MIGALVALLAAAPAAATVTVEQFTPQGTVKDVRQVTARFSEPMVPFGDLRDVAAPFAIDCPEPGTARWVDSRTWAYDFADDLPAGVRCSFAARDGLRSLAGEPLTGPARFAFSTGGPAVESTLPSDGSDRIEEEQVFVLALNGEPTADSVLAHAGFDIDGVAERVGVELISGEPREQLLRDLPVWMRPNGPAVVLKARQAFPNARKVRLVWGAGIAGASGIATEQDQVLEFTVRRVFTAKLTCERENAQAGCIPLTPMRLRFSAPVPWDLASRVVLVGPGETTRGPKPPDDPAETVTSVVFAPPFAESASFRVVFPADLHDDAGRPLANRDAAALTVQTAPLPPLAKFAARFGILEWHADPALPITIRNLDPEVTGSQLAVVEEPVADWRDTLQRLYGRLSGSAIQVTPQDPDQILPWLRRVATARRGASLFAGAAPPAGQEVRSFTLPQPEGPGAFQVVGIPFSAPGLYVVEIASPRLGAALLEEPGPMYVPAAALVTNLSVHFEWAREDALAWVTTLNGARPVGGARITVQDCDGKVLAIATTGSDGVARLDGLPDTEHAPRCYSEDRFADFDDFDYRDYYRANALNGLDGGLLVIAQTDGDLSFVHSSWMDGIEPWRFRLPSESWNDPVAVHTVLDRPLFRAGDTVHMKHVLRRKTMDGFGLFPPIEDPTATVIRHLGSNETYELPLQWDAGAATQEWPIPAEAKLGQYDVLVKRGDAQLRSGTFRIEQFRVPLMRATLQLPALPQVAAEAVAAEIAAQYLAGGVPAGLPVTLRAQIRPRDPPALAVLEHGTFANGPVREGVLRERESDEGDGERTPSGGMLQRQALTLDAAGTARAQITGLPAVDAVRELLAEVEYRDPNGELQTTAATVPLWPAALLPGIDAQSWAGAKDAVTARIAVVDIEGRPVAGAPVHVDVFQRRYYSHRKRLVGGFYAYEHIEETRRLGPLCDAQTGPDGLAECGGRPTGDGELLLQVTVSDRDGRVATAHESVFVSGDDEWGFPIDASDRIDVLPEKPQYEPGETARLQVRMPFRRATALVTVQREGIGAATVVPISAKEPVIEIPVEGSYAPNTFVSVFLVRGRVGDVQPTALVDLGRPAFKLGIAELKVGWRAHTLGVTVSADRPAYHVRDTATVRIAVRSADGSALPPGSEVALAAVDEGLLELMPNTSWKLLDAMMGRRGYGVRTATAQMEVIGKRHFGRKALPQGGGGGRQTTRELFDTLLLWQARVPLDATGAATVAVPLNDSLTSFRIAAVATAGTGEFGTGSTEIRSTQDLMLLSGLPPVVREGDVLPAQFTVRNTTDQGVAVEARIAVDGLAEPLPPQALTLDAGEARVIEWTIQVPPAVDHLRYTIEAAAPDGPADRLAVTQRVLPAVPVRAVQATLLRAEPELRVPVQRPADALPDRGGIEVVGAASLTGATMPPLEAWFATYPYTCLEQRVSVAVGLGDLARWDTIAASLPSYLDNDGLLKFFPTLATGSDVLTAYVVSLTGAAGWTIPGATRDRIAAGLRGFVDGSLRRESAVPAPDLALRKLAAIEALGRLGSADASLLDSISIEPNLWPTSAVLDWMSILQRVPGVPAREARWQAAEQIVRARLNLQGTTMGFSTDASDGLWWLMAGPEINAVRLVNQLVEFDVWRDDIPRLVRGALARQRHGVWSTTIANAWGAVALRRFAGAFEAEPVDGTTDITLAGTAEQLTWTEPPASVSLPWPAAPAELAIDHRGSGRPWFTLTSRAAIPLKAPLSSGYRITRTVTPVEPRVPGEMSAGDRLRVRLEIEAQSDMTWVVVDDPIPAGASHLGTGLGRDSQLDAGVDQDNEDTPRSPAFIERRFDAYVAYYDFVPKGRFSTEYVIRINQPGHFGLPPTRVQALYAPEMFGELPNQPVDVRP